MTAYRLRPVRDDERLTVLAWRNAPEVRQAMLTTEVISEDGHNAWWGRMMENPAYRMMILEADGTPLAVEIMFDLKPTESAWWAFYFTPHMPTDMGEMMRRWRYVEAVGIGYGFAHLGVKTLYCEVLRSNPGVLNWHKRFGFEVLPREVSDSPAHHDLEVLGMTRDAWDAALAKPDLRRWEEAEIVPHRFDESAAS